MTMGMKGTMKVTNENPKLSRVKWHLLVEDDDRDVDEFGMM